MKIRRAGLGVVAAALVSYLALLWSQAAQAQVKLQYKFPEGKKLTYKTTEKQRQVLTLMGMEIETEQSQTTVISSAIGRRRDDSSLPVEEKVESYRTQLSLPGNVNLTYEKESSAADPKVKIDNPQFIFLNDVFKLTSEVDYTVVLDEQNKVKAIEGVDKLLEKASKLDAIARESIGSPIDPDKIKAQFEQDHHNLPDVPARPGEPWERTEVVEIDSSQSLSLRKRYEYAGTEKKGDKTLDKITSKVLEVKYQQDPNTQRSLKVAKSNLKVDSSDQTILFDREEGQVVQSKGKIRIKGDMTFSGAGMDSPGQIEMIIETNRQLQPAAQ
jgi:Family of unknown function (DUF6263)